MFSKLGVVLLITTEQVLIASSISLKNPALTPASIASSSLEIMLRAPAAHTGFPPKVDPWSPNPVAAAGALSIINRIDDAFLKEVKEKSDYVFEALNGAEGVESVSGMGLMIGIKTKADAKTVVAKCIEKGVLCLTAKDKVRLLPALNIPMNILVEAVEIIKSVLKEEAK